MRKRRFDVLGQVLVGSLVTPRNSNEFIRLAAAIEPGRLIAAAEFHRISPFLYHRLGSALLASTRSKLRASYYASAANHSRALCDTKELGKILADASVPWLLVKGPVLAERYYPHAALRPYVDVDVIVAPAHFRLAFEALRDAGMEAVDRNWLLAKKRRFGELHLLLKHGTTVDLHWHLLNQPALRDTFTIDIGELFARACRVQVGEMSVWTLGITDTLAHLALHAALAGANRLIWLNDVNLVIRSDEFNWEGFEKRIHEWKATLPVLTVLKRAQRFLDTPLPPSAQMHPRTQPIWWLLTCLADRWSPVPKATNPASLARMVARSARRSQPSSVWELSRRAASWARGELGASRSVRVDAPSVLDPTGDANDTNAYFESVAAEARRSDSGRFR